jgi:ribulose-5-phosphate 4-epimerase/fuculose-1-phosphate aldolase
MATSEGIIQFAFDLKPAGAHGPDRRQLAALAAWHGLLRQLQLIGQAPDRYGGYAYGNLSAREVQGTTSFLITASQASAEPELTSDLVVRIDSYNLDRFWVEAEGAQPPSSETPTHAMIYAADPRIQWVMHVHSPEIWQRHEALRLPATPESATYGSRAMVGAVSALLDKYLSRPLVFVSLGHEDGVFACGHNARDCGGLLVSYLARALELRLVEEAS